MQISVVHLLFLLIGIVIGGGLIWQLLKLKIQSARADGRAESEVEHATLVGQKAAVVGELNDCRSRLSVLDDRNQQLQISLDKANQECATLTERSNQLTKTESAHRELVTHVTALTKEIADLREKNGGLISDGANKQRWIDEATQLSQKNLEERSILLRERTELQIKLTEATTELESEKNQIKEKINLLNEAKEQLANQFKSLANDILDSKGKSFAEQSQASVEQLLNPLREQIGQFKSKVEEVYLNESKDRSALGQQVKQLIDLNQNLSQEAKQLTSALKGNSKTQGNWGELLLDRVLERAGLVLGQHYDRQPSIVTEGGQSRSIPDVILHLPADRHLVIDAKLTLPDYRAFATAEADEDRAVALKKHVASVRSHMKGLAEKNYQNLYNIKTIDFVIMFVPLEPAFMLSVTNDEEIIHEAWDKNILLVSPSTLLFVVRTVAYLWRQEDIGQNAKDISRRGAELYDKLVSFVVDLDRVGDRLRLAQVSFDEARKKLSGGRGNAIRQAQMLKELGVKPTKMMLPHWSGSEESIECAADESPAPKSED